MPQGHHDTDRSECDGNASVRHRDTAWTHAAIGPENHAVRRRGIACASIRTAGCLPGDPGFTLRCRTDRLVFSCGNTSPGATVAVRKIAISVPEHVLAQVDAAAEERGENRS